MLRLIKIQIHDSKKKKNYTEITSHSSYINLSFGQDAQRKEFSSSVDEDESSEVIMEKNTDALQSVKTITTLSAHQLFRICNQRKLKTV